MSVLLPAFDAAAYRASLDGARARLAEAEALGRRLADGGRRRLVFVGCGASDCLASVSHYWAARHARMTAIARHVPAEMMAMEPPLLGADTVAVLSSKSGTTRETVAAAPWLRARGVVTVAVTERADSPLATACDHALVFGATDQAYYATWMVTQAVTLGFVDAQEPWPLAASIREALPALPGALSAAILAAETRNEALAHAIARVSALYVIGAGPCFATAYVFAVCVLMEMQRLHAQPIAGAEFFHGPFEIVDRDTPLILLVGEDPSRPLAERVRAFTGRHSVNTAVYDTAEAAMPGIPVAARGVVSPFILQCSLTRLAARLAVLRDHPLSTRRYMGRIEY